jgi:hypothetical protein
VGDPSLDCFELRESDRPEPESGEGPAVRTDLTDVDQVQDGFDAVRERFVDCDDVSTRPFEVHVTNGPQNSELT